MCSPLVDEGGHQPGPSRLVRRTEAGPGVAVKVLVEREVVAPVRIGLELGDVAVDRANALAVSNEDRYQAVGVGLHDLADGPFAPVLVHDGEIVSVGLGELSHRLDHQERGREPDGAAPVGVAALDLAIRLTRLVHHLVVAEDEGVCQMRLREAAKAVVGQEFVRVAHAMEHAL